MAQLRYRFHTLEFGDSDIHFRTLRDKQQYDDPEGLAGDLGISSASWPMYGVLWTAGEVLAHMMQQYDVEGLRILEVGCGVGLSSLLLNQRLADITATDHHPCANGQLQYNATLNGGPAIPFFRSDWGEPGQDGGEFDLIIGSDLLYEPNHAQLLSGFINHHTRAASRVIIIDANRGNSPAFCRHMDAFGFTHTRSRSSHGEAMIPPFKGQLLQFSRG